MMLGRMGVESGQYGMDPALIGNLTPGDLEKAVALLPASVYKLRDSSGSLPLRSDQVPSPGEVKEGGLADRDGHIVVRRGAAFEALTLPNSDSNRAFDMFLKIRYLQERSDGRGVVFATGTPISNTLAEMYTMLRYLAPEMLAERKVEHFDSWAANFAESVTSLELAPDGSGCPACACNCSVSMRCSVLWSTGSPCGLLGATGRKLAPEQRADLGWPTGLYRAFGQATMMTHRA